MANIPGTGNPAAAKIIFINVDPTDGGGVVATPGSIASDAAGNLWFKTGAGNTDWVNVASIIASNVAYTPGNGADWVDPDPTTVGAAIDRIAAQVAIIGVAPIP